jgi:dihydropteroate synthase
VRDIYIRPVGLIPAEQVTAPSSECLRLAGGWLDFPAVETIERAAGGGTRRRISSIAGFAERDWGLATLAAAADFEALREERPRLAGLSLDRPRIMGIVNVTPDSFSDGGRLGDSSAAIAHARRLAEEGAEILDIGGESTRPGAEPVSIDEELRRVLPVIEGLAGRIDARISIDTRNAEVMRRAVAAGADVVNDVSALSHDPGALEAVAEQGVPVVLMHARGDPRTMQLSPTYADVQLDVFDALHARIGTAVRAGIVRRNILVDPGIGFGKTLEHNLALLAGLALLHGLGVPIVLGASRKSVIGAVTGVTLAAERVHGSLAAALAGVSQGAQIVRVHDVAATRQALDVWRAATSGKAPPPSATVT